MKVCVVNFSDYRYKIGQDRLVESLNNNNFKGDIITFDSYEQVGSKSHSEVPYQFKVYAIEKARQMGYDIVLYCDASLYAIKDIQPCIDYIIQNGYLLENNDGNVAMYSTDTCLNEFGLNREESATIRLHSAGFTGLNFNNELCAEFFRQWYLYASQEKTFIGHWNNDNHECSNSSLCKGHRHDQTVASIVAYRLNMNRITTIFMQYEYDDNELSYLYIDEDAISHFSKCKNDSTVFLCRGID
jgi:hypothetical protein